MIVKEEKITWIEGTPVGINVRSIESVATHMHEHLIELIFCLKGSIRLSYFFEEFTLRAGEFISIDRDAHFIHGEKDNVCVSLYLNLGYFKRKYPFITSLLFVCEGTRESSTPYPTYYHEQLRGMIIALLLYIGNHKDIESAYRETVTKGSEKILDMMINHFDMAFYYTPGLKLKPEIMERYHNMMVYLQTHSSKAVSIQSMSEDFYLTRAYISEFMSKYATGFRKLLGYIRVNNSEKLLLTTNMNITTISEACGFSDPKYYYKSFHDWYQCTPRQFRVKYRSEMGKEVVEKQMSLEDALAPLEKIMLNHYMSMFLY